ncbi:hypothetical protein [Pedobacter sp. HMWF019]|uniref:hypothetical protein n=1 Tax=Pedobacter sp. HMWF019 TaxID=2056856 RepID=UPI0011B22E71|nr:hypothetical protein [Pedobacter sp. HMWF019]
MKITYKKIIIGLILIAAIMIIPDVSMYYQQYKLRSEKLPEIYKAYAGLDSLKDNEYEVLKINTEVIEPILQANESTIVITSGHYIKGENGDTLENVWYTINPKGEVIKSQTRPKVNVADAKEVKYQESTYDIDKNAGLISREFVHKENWMEYSFWNIGKNLHWGTGNSSGRKGWIGTSYFQIKMPKKMLHFKQFVEIDEDGTFRDRFSYFVYKPKIGEYLLLNDTPNRIYYLIRPKKTT